jgi:sigma-B regulation protein RsbU (phosphoserine phosphatase)
VITVQRQPAAASPPVTTGPFLRIAPHHDQDVDSLLSIIDQLNGRLIALESERSRLFNDFTHLDEQVRLASQVQRDLLPDKTDFAGIEVRTLYRPADHVSGDIFDVSRLDEEHFAVSLADASGHGMPAALLSVMLKRSFRGKQIINDTYRILDPAAVLRRVNQDVLETNFRQCQFVTGIHGVYNRSERSLTFARGGSPYPILIRRNCVPRQLVTNGPLIGAFESATFEAMTVELEHDDVVLFYTDGVEALLLDRWGDNPLDSIMETRWYAELATRRIEQSIAEIARRLDVIDPDQWPVDDISIVALRVRG